MNLKQRRIKSIFIRLQERLKKMEQLEFFTKQKATDWRWSMKDYPEKNGLKVFSCFACGGGSTS